MKTNLPAEGVIGAVPPPDAPMLPTQALQPDAGSIVLFDRETRQPTGEVVSPLERARANERELKPLTYGKERGEGESTAAPSPTGASPVIAGKKTSGLDPFYENLQQQQAVSAATVTTPASIDRALFPAGSNTDTPSRGLPRIISDPGKAITGGFGATPGEYFALNGLEVRTLVEQLMDNLHADIQHDLRFHMATCYPRAQVKLTLTVTAAVQDHPIEITHIGAPKNQAPAEYAEQHADSVCFVLIQQRREVDPTGQIETPADAIRDELGLPKPQKRLNENGFRSDVIF